MITIRRIYAYLLAFAGLAMLAFATANLGQLLIDLLLQTPSADTARHVRDVVAVNAAAALVGLPGVAAALALDRALGARQPRRASQHPAPPVPVRGAGRGAARAGVRDAGRAAPMSSPRSTRTRSQPGLDEVFDDLPYIAIAALIWIGHWRIAARDREPGRRSRRLRDAAPLVRVRRGVHRARADCSSGRERRARKRVAPAGHAESVA